MTTVLSGAGEIESAMARSRDVDWQARREAAEVLGRVAYEPEVERRLTEMLSDPDNISVIEAAASALATATGTNGLERIAEVFDSLDEQAGSYTALAVSEALGDSVLDRLRDVMIGASDARVADGARQLGALIGMRTDLQGEG